MHSATDYFDMTVAPMRIGRVRLTVRDLQAVSAIHQSVLGLVPLESDDRCITLGSGSTPLLELAGDASLALHDPRQAGLFHFAFLMPSRSDLGHWLAHASAARVRLQGATDHSVSEALYLADPEGNGIEVHADRPVSNWHGPDGGVRMTIDPLDVQDLPNSAVGIGSPQWSGFPTGGSIGHVHLQVGDTAEADVFYRDVLGFDVSARYPGASFYGRDGYHHQLAGNVWHSRGAELRRTGTTGLDAMQIVVHDAADLPGIGARAESMGIQITERTDGITLNDPWGTALALKVRTDRLAD